MQRLLAVVRGARELIGERTLDPVRAYLVAEELRCARSSAEAMLRDVQEGIDRAADAVDDTDAPCSWTTQVICRVAMTRDAAG